jgi:hypothetical protein
MTGVKTAPQEVNENRRDSFLYSSVFDGTQKWGGNYIEMSDGTQNCTRQSYFKG